MRLGIIKTKACNRVETIDAKLSEIDQPYQDDEIHELSLSIQNDDLEQSLLDTVGSIEEVDRSSFNQFDLEEKDEDVTLP